MKTKHTPLELATELLHALLQGPVHWTHLPRGFDNTDMYTAVRFLQSVDIPVHRIDAGGSPTWELE